MSFTDGEKKNLQAGDCRGTPTSTHAEAPATSLDSIQNLFPLSPMQTGMLLHTLTRDERAYRMQMRLNVSGPLVPACLESAWRGLIARHDIFRSLFALSGAPDPLQVVLKDLPVKFSLPVTDLSMLSAEAQKRETDLLAEAEFSCTLDPKRPPLMRVLLLRYSGRIHTLIITFHHILMDGWCQGILHNELLALYAAAASDTAVNLPPAPNYAEYIRWLMSRNPAASRTYWQRRLQEIEEPSYLPGHRPTHGEFAFSRRSFSLSTELTQRLRRIGAEYDAPFNAVFQALWAVLVARCGNSASAVFGMVVSGRPPEVPGIDGMVGLFINTVPMVIEVKREEAFRDLIRRVAVEIAEGLSHHYMPTPEILESHPLRERLLTHAIAFENFPEREEPDHPDAITLSAEGDFQGYTNFDLLCVVDPGDPVSIHLKFNRNAIPEDRVNFLAAAFLELAEAAALAPANGVGTIPFLPAKERRSLLTSLCAGKTRRYPWPTVLEGFHDIVRKYPRREAILASDGRLTYQELEARAHRLANGLLTRSAAGTDRPIALLLERDSWMIPALLGVLFSGSAYLPIAPDYPPERIRFLLDDADCRTVISRQSLFARLPAEWTGERYDVEELASAQASTAPAITPCPGDMAYIIYTSGSTGNPKGVAVDHGALANFTQGFNDCLDLPAGEPGRVAFIANYVFDASGRAIYPPLLRGAAIAVVDAQTRVDGTRLARLIKEERLDILDGTPTLCSLLLQAPEALRSTLRLRHLICGGEAMPAAFPLEVEAAGVGSPTIHNVYGPTETTIDSTWKCLPPAVQKTGQTAIAIGRALPNQQVYILDARLDLLPRGAEGELCIAGAGLARGYLHQEALTQEKFIPLPWDPSIRIYRTGDRARWNEEGDIDYLGRMDQQVKIRGYRIEPGEIEARLNEHPQVTTSVVIARTLNNDIGPELIAYYTVRAEDPGEEELHRWLSTLPSHMIPGNFLRIESIPLTATGKINRRALPMPDRGSPSAPEHSAGAENDREALLIQVWSQVLGRKSMGRRDNFFDLGGHSLRAAQAATRTGQAFARDIPPTWIYLAPTPADFARLLEERNDGAAGSLLETHFSLGAGRAERLFCLPPYGGSGIAYTALHKALDGIELVCLNAPEEPGNFSQAAAQLICALEPEKQIHLLGYSGGGNFAFQVSKHLEASGRKVGCILLIDSHRRLETVPVATKLIAREIDELLRTPQVAVYLESPAMRRSIRARAIRYAEELYQETDSGVVAANIGLLCAEEVFPFEPYRDSHGLLRSRRAWAECTTGNFRMVNAAGAHDTILSGEFAPEAADQITTLFHQLQELT